MRLINADKLKANFRENCKDCIFNGTDHCKNTCLINRVCDRVDLQATVVESKIPTFNRKELEKARDYWYNHLEVGNEEQNEAAWAAINAIKYCIEHSSGYQKGAENESDN